MLTLAIQPDHQLLTSGQSQSFSTRWVERAALAGIAAKLVDVYDGDLIAQVRGCDAFLWWFAHLPERRNVGKRVVLAIAHGMRIATFPDFRTIWHFDDKVAQKYLLDAAGIAMPRTWVFWTPERARAFCRAATYPMVIKLAGGIVSENVRRVADVAEAEYWIHRMFTAGVTSFDGWPRPARPRRAWTRLETATRVLRGNNPFPTSRRTELQRGYVLFQEFVPGNDFDTRVTVIGDRAFAYRRINRPDDFRASGSGLRDTDSAKIDAAAVSLAFATARALGTQSLAVDVLGTPDGRHVLTEISYYYEGWIVAGCPGHWRSDGSWHAGPLAPEDAIFDDFVAGLRDTGGRVQRLVGFL